MNLGLVAASFAVAAPALAPIATVLVAGGAALWIGASIVKNWKNIKVFWNHPWKSISEGASDLGHGVGHAVKSVGKWIGGLFG